jgi:hypothetical protein
MSGKPGQKPTKPLTLPANAPLGADVLELVDGRSLAARSLRSRLTELHTDLGGATAMSHAQQSLVLRVANLEVFIAVREAELLRNGFKADAESMRAHFQAVGLLLQLYTKLGLKRVAKQIPDLQTYLRQKSAEKAAQQESLNKESLTNGS